MRPDDAAVTARPYFLCRKVEVLRGRDALPELEAGIPAFESCSVRRRRRVLKHAIPPDQVIQIVRPGQSRPGVATGPISAVSALIFTHLNTSISSK
jgi:hypothetical protein